MKTPVEVQSLASETDHDTWYAACAARQRTGRLTTTGKFFPVLSSKLVRGVQSCTCMADFFLKLEKLGAEGRVLLPYLQECVSHNPWSEDRPQYLVRQGKEEVAIQKRDLSEYSYGQIDRDACW